MKTSHSSNFVSGDTVSGGTVSLYDAVCFARSSQRPAQADSVKIPSGRCNVVLVEELNKLIGGWVCITLNSGETFSGVVMKERDGLVHLAKVQDKGYFDVLIRIADISALGVRFRVWKK